MPSAEAAGFEQVCLSHTCHPFQLVAGHPWCPESWCHTSAVEWSRRAGQWGWPAVAAEAAARAASFEPTKNDVQRVVLLHLHTLPLCMWRLPDSVPCAQLCVMWCTSGKWTDNTQNNGTWAAQVDGAKCTHCHFAWSACPTVCHAHICVFWCAHQADAQTAHKTMAGGRRGGTVRCAHRVWCGPCTGTKCTHCHFACGGWVVLGLERYELQQEIIQPLTPDSTRASRCKICGAPGSKRARRQTERPMQRAHGRGRRSKGAMAGC